MQRILALLFVLGAWICPAGPLEARPVSHDELEPWLDGFMASSLEQGRIAGAVVVVVDDGRVVLQKGYGFSDVAKRTPVDPERTLFRPGSISKLFTAIAVMQQVEQGRLDLDRDIDTYLDFKIPPRDGGPITLRHLLTHTAGFGEYVHHLWALTPSGITPLGQHLKSYTPPRLYPAGRVAAYSNYGIALAGYIVERVSGEPYAAYVQRHILTPLGMTRSTFAQPLPASLAADMSKGYTTTAAPPRPFELLNPTPAGAMTASGADMGRFMIAMLGAQPILKPQTLTLMQRTDYGAAGPLRGMGLGFQPADRNGYRAVTHGGSSELFKSNLHLIPSEGVGIFVSFNAVGEDDAAQGLRDALWQQFMDRWFPGPEPAAPVMTATAEAHAGKLAGRYEDSRHYQGGFLSLASLEGQFLMRANPDGTVSAARLKGPDGRVQKWRETAPWVFADERGKSFLVATPGPDGRVERFRGANAARAYVRVPMWRSAGWNMSALNTAQAILALVLVGWAWNGGHRRALLSGLRPVHLLAVTNLVLVAGWMQLIKHGMAGSQAYFAGPADPWVWALRGLGVLALAGVVAAGRELVEARGWPARVWSAVLFLAFLDIAWVVLAFGLLSPSLGY